ncbi:MAG: hypothetical protein Q9208_001827 [Pyrenodesmia sp. 3 TL-2023]
MHRIKNWAHSTARTDTHNAWSQDASTALATEAPSAASSSSPTGNVSNNAEKGKGKPKGPVWRRFYNTLKKICLSSWINVLLVFVPIGIACNLGRVNPTLIFAMNAIAIIPLAGMLSFATESVAHRLGDTLGALLNVSFGNAVELIIFIALVKNQVRIVQASLLGSILANLLLILGMAFLIGGLQYQEQVYNSTVTQLSACLLCLAVLSLLIPSHAYLYKPTPQHIVDEESQPGILQRMHSTSCSSTTTSTTRGSAGSRRITRKKIRAKLGRRRKSKTEPDIENAEEPRLHLTCSKNKGKAVAPETVAVQPSASGDHPTAPGVRPMGPLRLASAVPPVFRNPTGSVLRSVSATHSSPPIARRLQSESHLRLSLQSGGKSASQAVPELDEPTEPPLSRMASVLLLLGSTALVALCAEFMVESINHLVVNTPLSEAFVGLIIIPIVGNAAEHVTAVTVAAKNKMDLAIGVAIGSSIQIATFITPIVVIIGWMLGKDMPLYFTLFETVILFVAAFVVNFLVLDGRSNYLEGALLCSSYIIIAVAAFFFPNIDKQSRFSGPPERHTFAAAMVKDLLA